MHFHAIEDLDQQVGELPLLCLIEGTEQIGANAFDMAGRETPMQAATVLGEAGKYPAAVLTAGLARHEFGVFESSNTVSKPAR